MPQNPVTRRFWLAVSLLSVMLLAHPRDSCVRRIRRYRGASFRRRSSSRLILRLLEVALVRSRPFKH